jgi:hypothetical protein
VYNVTVIGAGVGMTGAGGDNDTMLLREFLQAKIYNGVFTDFARRGITLGPKGDYGVTNGTLQLCNNLWWGYTGGDNPNSASNIVVTAAAGVYFSDASRSNVIADPMLTGISRVVGFGLDPRPQSGSPAWTGAREVPNDGYYTPVSYQGAFGSENWATDWSALGAYCILSPRGARNPKKGVPAGGDACTPPDLLIVRNGANVDIRFASQAGFSYQVQSAASLNNCPACWSNEGAPIAGTGATLTHSSSTAGGQKFFRVVCQ